MRFALLAPSTWRSIRYHPGAPVQGSSPRASPRIVFEDLRRSLSGTVPADLVAAQQLEIAPDQFDPGTSPELHARVSQMPRHGRRMKPHFVPNELVGMA